MMPQVIRAVSQSTAAAAAASLSHHNNVGYAGVLEPAPKTSDAPRTPRPNNTTYQNE